MARRTPLNKRGNWIVSLDLSFTVKIYWLPKYASWLDQVEIIFRKLQRDVADAQ